MPKLRLCNLSLEERLKRLNITTLKDRQKRGDIIEICKVIRSLDEIECIPLLRTGINLRTDRH